MLRFRLFGVDVEVQLFFWLMAVLLGPHDDLGNPSERLRLAIWVPVVFLSILVHEFGHAAAIMRHKIEPNITLHGMGGTTHWNPVLPLRQRDLVFISLAGPFAGFAFAVPLYAIYRLAPMGSLPNFVEIALGMLIWVNVFWGLFNLIPVFPFDGGHVLEHAFGPKRLRISSAISLTIAVGLGALALVSHQYWIAILLGMSAVTSYRKFRSAEPIANPVRERMKRDESNAEEPPEASALIQSARNALELEDTKRALALSRRVLEGDGGAFTPTPRSIVRALEIVAWAELIEGRADAANEALIQAKKHGEPDAAVVGAVLFARRVFDEARRVLEAARAKGDDRKEIVGPLIQTLLEQGEVARAASAALDIVDSLSDEDARRMARIAFEGAAYEGAARLDEALFTRTQSADDAYEAARALARGGDVDGALEMLRRAVKAGFSDRARAWSDAAFEALRARRLDDILPRP